MITQFNNAGMDPAPSEKQDRMLRWFRFDHLPVKLQAVSEPFCAVAFELVHGIPAGPERTAALRKLVEAKDAAVRAYLEAESST